MTRRELFASIFAALLAPLFARLAKDSKPVPKWQERWKTSNECHYERLEPVTYEPNDMWRPGLIANPADGTLIRIHSNGNIGIYRDGRLIESYENRDAWREARLKPA